MAAAAEMQKLHEATVEVERLGELFLINKDAIVEADRQRQANREALSALRRAARAAAAETGPSTSGSGGGDGGGSSAVSSSSARREPQEKVWLLPSAVAGAAPGGSLPVTFARHTAPDAIRRLEEEQKRLDGEVDRLRAEQKRLTALLADKGAGPESAGEGLLRAMLTLRDGGEARGGGGGDGSDSD